MRETNISQLEYALLDGTPEGTQLAYYTRGIFRLLGTPKHDDENHNCDDMGCASFGPHVLEMEKAGSAVELDRLRAENAELRAELRSTKELHRTTRENRDFLSAEYVNLEDANRELRAEINALNMSHSITVGELRMKLNSESERLHSSELEATTLAAQLEQERAKMATMVCRDCLGSKHAMTYTSDGKFMNGIGPCPVCQPKGGSKP